MERGFKGNPMLTQMRFGCNDIIDLKYQVIVVRWFGEKTFDGTILVTLALSLKDKTKGFSNLTDELHFPLLREAVPASETVWGVS